MIRKEQSLGLTVGGWKVAVNVQAIPFGTAKGSTREAQAAVPGLTQGKVALPIVIPFKASQTNPS